MSVPIATPFDDEKHRENVFVDAEGHYCNCWRNKKVEEFYVPKLEAMLKQHLARK
jgi:hypothetical protein